MGVRSDLEMIRALMRRALNEILRVPGAAIPGVLAPTIFFLGLTAVFGNLTLLPGFTSESYQSFLIPVSLMQGAGFTGAATGVNLARDIEQGWFDRLLASPAPRPVLLAGLVLSASFRALVPATVLLAIGFSLGVHWPGPGGLAIALLITMGMAIVAAAWGTTIALKFKSQSASPLMQAGMLRPDPDHDRLRAARPAERMAPGGRPLQPGHPGGRGRAAGIRRLGDLGRDVARAARARRAHGPARRPGAARNAADCGLSEDVAGLAERVLAASWAEGSRDGVPYAYTRPSPGRYPWQWYWDSCFAAIVWRRFDADRARAELETLLRGGREDGFIGHTIFWDRPVSLLRSAFYNVRSRSSPSTETIQPPLLGWAWRIAVGDPAVEPRIVAHHDWLVANRDLDGDGLLWIVQPDESGLDSSPKFDPVWGRRAHGRLGFPLLVRRNRRLDWDARRVLGAGGPRALRGGRQRAVVPVSARPRPALGYAGDRRAAVRPPAGPVPRRGAPRRRAPGGRDVGRAGAAGAAGPPRRDRPPPGRGASARRGPLLAPGGAPPSVAATEPSFESDRSGGLFRRYWRGPTWVNAAWMLWLGLLRLGYEDEAAAMTRALRDTVLREGMREYYDPHDGDGLGARDFAWSALLVEMTDPDPAATSSYMGGSAPLGGLRPPPPGYPQ